MPAFNEGPRIARRIRAIEAVLQRTDWAFEVIVVDDGSTDGTAAGAQAVGVRVLRHRRNRGCGAALKRGISAASHDWILIIDADGPGELEVRDAQYPMLIAVRARKAVSG